MAFESSGPGRRASNKSCADSSSSISSIFESRPDESLLSADLLSSLYSPSCSDKEAEDRAYRTLLPLVKRQVSLFKENPHLESSGEFRIACAVCPQQTLFRGWSALHIHAQKYWKSFPHQHQGYSKALNEVLQAEIVPSLAVAATTDGLSWPPVLLVDNGAGKTTFDGSLRRWKGLHGTNVPSALNDMELEEVLAVYKKRRGDDRDVVIYPASEIGILDAEKLAYALDQNPQFAKCLKVRVLKDEDQLKSNMPRQFHVDDGHQTHSNENEKDGTWGATHSEFDNGKHCPLGTWQSLKEIRDGSRVNSIIGKWAKGFSMGKEQSFTFKWPFQKSRKLREMDAKFQKTLRKHHASGAVGCEKLKVQLDEIDKQLKKERLLWLKEITGVREQFEDFERDIANEETQKDLDRRIIEMNLEKAMDAKSDDELEKLFAYRLRHGRCMRRRRQQSLQDKERNRELLLREWHFEENNFRKQAELAKEERHCITRSLEHEEMIDFISKILKGCECCKHGDKAKECGCHV